MDDILCLDAGSDFFGFSLSVAPKLLLYSYIPVVIIALIIGFFVLTKNRRSLNARLLFVIAILFSLHTLSQIIQWTAVSVSIVHLSWKLIAAIEILMFIFFSYFVLSFRNHDNDIGLIGKIFLFLPAVPVLIALPTEYNMVSFNLSECLSNFNVYWYYVYWAEGFLILSVVLLTFLKPKSFSSDDNGYRKEVKIISFGTLIFSFIFIGSNLLGDLTLAYEVNLVGPIGMLVFLSLLAYIIVKYKAFDIKLIGAQALVWALVILIGSQFFFIQSNTNKILTGITLIISAIVGLIIVRGVKKEISQRERIERLAKDLEFSNKGQENLIHIMNHQIKGFLGITRNIFAELLQSDDYGKMPEEAKPLLTKGLETTSSGVNYVQEILRGSNAEKGTLAYDMKPLNIKELVTTLCAEQKDIAVKKDLSFETELTEGDFNTIGDTTHLIEAFKNLITNAIKYNDYSDPNRGIKVILTEKGDKIIYSVRDTGIGIAEEDKPRLFTAGGMGKDSTKYNVESSGFGLAYVKGVAEAHKGRVGFKSNAPEKGTTFYMELPKKS